MSRDGLIRRLWPGRKQREQDPAVNQIRSAVPAKEVQPTPELITPQGEGLWCPGLVVAGLYEVGERLGAGGWARWTGCAIGGGTWTWR